MTASGRLLRADGSPLTYAGGEAREVADPERAPVTFFTSSDGRYAISGVKPGRWRLTMATDPPTIYEIEVGETAEGLVSVGRRLARGRALNDADIAPPCRRSPDSVLVSGCPRAETETEDI